ncbi:MAG: ABC transporter ATP-binding protein [Pirellulales bacterium]|nr:ABC transporter ATP-binding protein [Pirellulales bacterium]
MGQQHALDNPIVRVRDFSFAFAGRKVLDRVSFAVARGEAVSIVGPNGAGKTTLLKCLGGLLAGGSGHIEIDGRPVASYARRELAKQISYVPQADGQVVAFTVEQFVLMGRYPYLSPFSPVSAEDRETALEALAQTGLTALANRRMDTLSGGERQKAYLAAAVAQDAPIMLLDEPTTFLDYRHQAEIGHLLAHHGNQAELTTISVTHDVNRAALESQRILALVDGRIRFDAPAKEIMRPDVLETIFGTPFLLVDHPDTGVPMVVPRTVTREAP